MKISELFVDNGKKWDDLIIYNDDLRVSYFQPKFDTADGIAIGVDDAGHGKEFSMTDHDGWKLKLPEPFETEFFKVIEVFRTKDCKYISVASKEWHRDINDAVSLYKKDGYHVTRVMSEVKSVSWDSDKMYVVVDGCNATNHASNENW